MLRDARTGSATRSDHDDAPDEELVVRVVAGSHEALASLYDRHAPEVFRTALSINRDRSAAEEVVQETFLALWDRAEQYDATRGSLHAWLATIARHRAIDRHRAAARRLDARPFSTVATDGPDAEAMVEWLFETAEPVAAAAPEPLPEVALATSESVAEMARAIADLADAERETILLAYRDGLTQSEIAAHLGWPLGTVKTRSRRALRRLREALAASEARPADAPPAARVEAEAASRGRPREPSRRVAEPLAGCC